MTIANEIDRDCYAGRAWFREAFAKQWAGAEYHEWWDRAADVLGFAFRGIYHVEREVLRGAWTADWARVTIHGRGDMATFDTSVLTRLVVAAHDLCIRVAIEGASPHYCWLHLSPRTREGDTYHRHPTIEEAIARMRQER